MQGQMNSTVDMGLCKHIITLEPRGFSKREPLHDFMVL